MHAPLRLAVAALLTAPLAFFPANAQFAKLKLPYGCSFQPLVNRSRAFSIQNPYFSSRTYGGTRRSLEKPSQYRAYLGASHSQVFH